MYPYLLNINLIFPLENKKDIMSNGMQSHQEKKKVFDYNARSSFWIRLWYNYGLTVSVIILV